MIRPIQEKVTVRSRRKTRYNKATVNPDRRLGRPRNVQSDIQRFRRMSTNHRTARQPLFTKTPCCDSQIQSPCRKTSRSYKQMTCGHFSPGKKTQTPLIKESVACTLWGFNHRALWVSVGSVCIRVVQPWPGALSPSIGVSSVVYIKEILIGGTYLTFLRYWAQLLWLFSPGQTESHDQSGYLNDNTSLHHPGILSILNSSNTWAFCFTWIHI